MKVNELDFDKRRECGDVVLADSATRLIACHLLVLERLVDSGRVGEPLAKFVEYEDKET